MAGLLGGATGDPGVPTINTKTINGVGDPEAPTINAKNIDGGPLGT
jgi:hypothetical protein